MYASNQEVIDANMAFEHFVGNPLDTSEKRLEFIRKRFKEESNSILRWEVTLDSTGETVGYYLGYIQDNTVVVSIAITRNPTTLLLANGAINTFCKSLGVSQMAVCCETSTAMHESVKQAFGQPQYFTFINEVTHTHDGDTHSFVTLELV
jgi:argonaute-like protein implicated in RNA metabolism and viral defense